MSIKISKLFLSSMFFIYWVNKNQEKINKKKNAVFNYQKTFYNSFMFNTNLKDDIFIFLTVFVKIFLS